MYKCCRVLTAEMRDNAFGCHGNCERPWAAVLQPRATFLLLVVFSGICVLMFNSAVTNERIRSPGHTVRAREIVRAREATTITPHVMSFNKTVQSKEISLALHNISGTININIQNIFEDNFQKKKKDIPLNIEQPFSGLLILFTTWKSSNARSDTTHNFTLRNWANLKPDVNPVLFTDDDETAKFARKFGWKSHPIPKIDSSTQLPVLKSMFKFVQTHYRSAFYGYSNSDILYTENLIQTLNAVQYSPFFGNSTLLTGIRTNLLYLTESEFASENFTSAVRKRGNVFMTSAEDYFIYGSGYPFKDIPEVVVGLIAYDNWLVLNSRFNGDNVIDASQTITAVHISMTDDYFRSHFRPHGQYNRALLKKHMQFHVEPPYEKGFTNCIERYTENVDGRVVVKQRHLDNACKF